MGRNAERKEMPIDWENKMSNSLDGSSNLLFFNLDDADSLIEECDNELKATSGISPIFYNNQINEINKRAREYDTIIRFIFWWRNELNEFIDYPFFSEFNGVVNRTLSEIRLENFETNNTLGLESQVFSSGRLVAERERESIGFIDFLGGIEDNKQWRAGMNHMERFPPVQGFADLFNESFQNKINGIPEFENMTFIQYQTWMLRMGEFKHTVHNPFRNFMAMTTDILPFYSGIYGMVTGRRPWTGEELSDLGQALGVASVALDIFALGKYVRGARSAGRVGTRRIASGYVSNIGRDFITDGTNQFVVNQLDKKLEEMGLPPSLRWISRAGFGFGIKQVGSGNWSITNNVIENISGIGVKDIADLMLKIAEDGYKNLDIERLTQPELDALANGLQNIIEQGEHSVEELTWLENQMKRIREIGR